MNFGNLFFQQPYNIRKQVRNIETDEKKLIQAKMAVVFNNTCIYIYIYIYTTILPLLCTDGRYFLSVFRYSKRKNPMRTFYAENS